MKILVVGVPGSGKTTYVRNHLAGGLCFDMDWLSGAFSMEDHKAADFDFTGIHPSSARALANALLPWFVEHAGEYAERVIIIRSAPDIGELEMIAPDKIVICKRPQAGRNLPEGTIERQIDRLLNLEEWAKDHGIPIEERFNAPRRNFW